MLLLPISACGGISKYFGLVCGIQCSLLFLLSIVFDSLLFLSWSSSVEFFYFFSLTIFEGYSISWTLILFSITLIFVVDVVCWLSFLYTSSYVRIMNELSSLFFFWVVSLLVFYS